MGPPVDIHMKGVSPFTWNNPRTTGGTEGHSEKSHSGAIQGKCGFGIKLESILL